MSFEAMLNESNISFSKNEPMSLHTTFKIGGSADYFIVPDSSESVAAVLRLCKEYSVPFIVVGRGSNLLVHDEGYRGAVICVSSRLSEISEDQKGNIRCGAGASLSSICDFALKHSLCGLEFAYGIPGNVGGAVAMNAGAYGGEIKDVIVSCEYVTDNGEIKTLYANELELSYRHSFFSDKNCCIIGAVFKLSKGKRELINQRMTEILGKRKEKQPLEFPSAGSTFKRPEGSYASLLIDECGLKGYRIGDAQVSEKHAGFIINVGKATFDDVSQLIHYVQQTVLERKGYVLTPEVKII